MFLKGPAPGIIAAAILGGQSTGPGSPVFGAAAGSGFAGALIPFPAGRRVVREETGTVSRQRTNGEEWIHAAEGYKSVMLRMFCCNRRKSRMYGS